MYERLNPAAVPGQDFPPRPDVLSLPGQTLPAQSAFFPKWRNHGFKCRVPIFVKYIFFANSISRVQVFRFEERNKELDKEAQLLK